MNVHEYQAKQILARFGVPVPDGEVAETPAAAREIAQRIGGKVVVKAQIHAGGRGKGGGIKLAATAEEAETLARGMLGKALVTPQTGPKGRIVRKVYVTRALDLAHEYYLSVLVDRARARLTIIASAEGGVEIEKVAAETPDKIIRAEVDPIAGYQPHVGRRVAAAIGLTGPAAKQFGALLANAVRAFEETDASLIEINPLVTTPDGRLFALDAKLSFDDNALFRRPEIAELRDEGEEDPLEVEASHAGLNYVKLEGSVACMVNGAGLAMATMDIIDLAGARPANFLDVGGGASRESVTAAFGILLRDPAVKAVLVNIFGGIVRCDRVAEGIIAAARDVNIQVPLVVRLQGTNAKQAREMLESSGLAIQAAEELGDAATKVVAAQKGGLR